jgi:predicted ATPase
LRQAAQRAIFHIQRELESVADSENAAVVLCDRGTVDCAAYWTGEGDLFSDVGTTHTIELARYDTVIHLRTPTSSHAYSRDNPLRVESIDEAAAIDVRIAAEWSDHPQECCRHHVRRFFWDDGASAEPGP